ncbi:hypothetical protein Cadr_000001667 [Camelus dromedarius]|uniref:Uncharacterized protein n=1 Tax=Camelus dromedarius TaxID=9838 RepID=A0A5N4EFN1_CAMDR|nr:hypothetical protein Cadr_000001667 [Camelus dromedarius]
MKLKEEEEKEKKERRREQKEKAVASSSLEIEILTAIALVSSLSDLNNKFIIEQENKIQQKTQENVYWMTDVKSLEHFHHVFTVNVIKSAFQEQIFGTLIENRQ